MKCRLLLFACALLASSASSQTQAPPRLTLSSPADYQVFQRQTKTTGKIVIESSLETTARGALTNLERLEVRLIDRSRTNDLSPRWQPLPFDNRVRRFRAEIAAPAGGWYRLELRVTGRGQTISETNVEHVGIGEVFLIAGQSNSANHGEGHSKPQSPLVAAFGNGRWQPAADPQPGASGTGGSFLPAFGDAMVQRFNVPIGLIPIGVGSTSVREWLPKGDVMAAPPTTGRHTILIDSDLWVSSGELYDRLIEAQRSTGTNGFRAVLWHQGESDAHQAADREITPAQYRQYLQHVIEASRSNAGWRVPWFVAQVSYHSPQDRGLPELRAAQKSLVTDGIALAGPNTDELGPEFREKEGKGIHFNARGLQGHGELWAEHVGPWLEQLLNAK